MWMVICFYPGGAAIGLITGSLVGMSGIEIVK